MVPPVVRPTSRSDVRPTQRLAYIALLFSALALAGKLFLPPSGAGRGGDDARVGADVVVVEEVMSPSTLMKASQGGGTSSSKVAAAGGGGGAGDDEGIKTKEELDEVDVNPLAIVRGSVTYDGGGKVLPYYHCGPLPSSSSRDDAGMTELVLLHGAAFTKEDWKTSGILDMLCEINNEEDEGDLSILALDLPVSADGRELGMAFDALASDRMLTGRPATFVSPSASGKAIVGLGEMATTGDGDGHELTRIVRAWIPVASGAVLKAADSTLIRYRDAKIPILSIHGDKDEPGKRATEKLKELSDANGVELEGRHPVYLDSPEEFVREVMQFLDEKGL
ncbi:hypothetical protein ACHAW5_009504 [Stephanodiscus triporus]|uniref:AB hydrolase-1 domain-containing protein n=1 Tax=Stephanodiscus triporus TaxID=2934178 RepID=A0ABD3NA06_9STRA